MNLTPSMRAEASSAVERAARAWLVDRPVSEASMGDFARSMADAALTAALADVLAREEAVYRPDVAELARKDARIAELEAELERRVPAYARLPRTMPGEGAA